MDSTSIIKSVETVTAKWTRQRKQEERGRAQSRRDALMRPCRVSIKDVAWRIMPEAYAKASSPIGVGHCLFVEAVDGPQGSNL